MFLKIISEKIYESYLSNLKTKIRGWIRYISIKVGLCKKQTILFIWGINNTIYIKLYVD